MKKKLKQCLCSWYDAWVLGFIRYTSTVLFFFFVFFFLFLFLPQIVLRLPYFFFFFLPQSWCLAFLNSLYLLILLKPKPKPICLKLLFQINGSLSLAFFFCGFLCIWCCRLAMVRWRAWVCGDQHGGGLSLWIGMVEGVGLWWSVSVVEFWSWHRSEFGSVDDGLHDCFGGWIGNGWWLDWSLVVGFSDGTNWSLVMGFVHRFEFSDGFRS